MRLYLVIPLMGIGDLIWWAWAHQRLKHTRHARRWRIFLAAFIVLQILLMQIWMYKPTTVRSVVGWVPAPALASVYIWHLILVPVGVAIAALDVATRLLASFWRFAMRKPLAATSDIPKDAISSNAYDPTPEDALSTSSRREFMGRAMVATAPVLLFGGVGRGLSQFGDFRVRPFNLSFAGLPPALDGVTIAHVTDVHVGRFSSSKGLRQMVETVNQLRADLIVLTGDLIDYAISDLPVALDLVKKMDPRHALAMCLGNHDLIDNPGEFLMDVRKAGVPLLIGGEWRIPIGSSAVQLMGLDWIRRDLDQVKGVRSLPRRQPDAFPILLAHHPHAFDAAAEAGLPLTLSGHTHGGLLMANDHFGAGTIMFRYWSGLYKKNASKLIVSNGVGTWFPLRVNAPAEIVHITLRRA